MKIMTALWILGLQYNWRGFSISHPSQWAIKLGIAVGKTICPTGMGGLEKKNLELYCIMHALSGLQWGLDTYMNALSHTLTFAQLYFLGFIKSLLLPRKPITGK